MNLLKFFHSTFSLLFFISSNAPLLATSSCSFIPNRRILHQPFFPQSSTSAPNQQPFFPSYPSPLSPPPPLSPPNAAHATSLPVNISSLILPHSPTPQPASKKLIGVTVALSLSAAIFATVALFFYFRGKRNRRDELDRHDKDSALPRQSQRSANNNAAPPSHPQPQVPQLRNSGNNSAEFLYLGTLANSSAAIDGSRSSSTPMMIGKSPELQPLPPLVGRQLQPQGPQQQQQWRMSQEQEPQQKLRMSREQDHHQQQQWLMSQEQEKEQEEGHDDEFYSPRGSVSGRESGSSGSRRMFNAVVQNQAQVQARLHSSNNGANLYDMTSSSSSASDSPARSASLSISSPITVSPKNMSSSISIPKSSPEFFELQVQHRAQAPPASPPLPEINFSPPYSPSSAISTGSGRERKSIKEEDEAEESPLLSTASSSSRMSSPPESPRLSPLTGKIGKVVHEEREWNVLGRKSNSPSASPVLSGSSTPSRRSSYSPSSFRLPAFLGGGKRKFPPDLSSMTNSPVSPHLPPSPMSSCGSSSRRTRSYPNSPLSNVSDRKRLSTGGRFSNVAPPPPPPPPPPPALRRSQSPPPQQAKSVGEDGGIVTPLRVVVEKQAAGGPVEGSGSGEGDEFMTKPKLKPLHWDKVRASSDKEMVWDQFRSSSFKLNEEMIESLFVVNTPNPNQTDMPRKPVQPPLMQENRVLDPKKAQNIAILLRALNVTMDEVCEALIEGNSETLGTELLESLLKMAPSKEEERKLKDYKEDSPVKLGHAEKFLKAVIDIPYAFKRVEAMLYVTNFESEVEYLNKSFDTLEVACDELRSSRMFLRLLEAVLKTGNRMNVGTNRGDAHAFKLDTLLKLVDVKGADGKTTLLHFVVQEIIRTEGQRLSVANNETSNDEAKCRKLGLQVVSALSSELTNVKKSAAMDSNVLSNDVAKLSLGLANIAEIVRLNEQAHLQESSRGFSQSMNRFMKMAEEEIYRVQAQERVTLSLVKEITEYFHGNSAKEEAHPFRIFMVVRDFLSTLDRVCREVGMINERTVVSSAHRFPVPVNPMLPVPVNPFHPQVLPVPGRRLSSSSDDYSR